jgi:predicted DCC family thiol-disulfide oxidoreductase YuxK
MTPLFSLRKTWLKPTRTNATQNFVLFDGVCGLCNFFIDFLLNHDKEDVLLYAPLQGETAKQFVANIDPENLETVVFNSNGKTYTKSDAVIEILQSIGGIWRLAVIFKVVPKSIRDAVYSYVAKNRLSWFGKKETCRMPTEKERGKLWK